MQPIGPSPASPQIPRGFVPVATEHDDTVLVAALEETERTRQALETLLDADLFKYCLGSQ
jgi:hypothetical protein